MKNLLIFLFTLLFLYISYKLYPRVKARYNQYIEEKKIVSMDRVMTSKELKTLDGKKWSIQKHRGKKIVIIFWAKNCRYCVEEIPNVKKFYSRHKTDSNLEIITYSRDMSMKTELLKEFVEKMNIDYPILIESNTTDDNRLFSKQFKIFGLPSIFIINKDGKLEALNLRRVDEVEDYL